MNELLIVEGVTKRFGNRCVLDDVTFSVAAGEILGLIGPNGAGKTTLFECVAGLLPVNAGTIRFHQNALKASRRKSALFYVPEGIVPWSEQKVKWAISFFAQLFRRPESDVSELVQSLKLDILMQSRSL